MIELDFLVDFDSKGLLLLSVQSFALTEIMLYGLDLVNMPLVMHMSLRNSLVFEK